MITPKRLAGYAIFVLLFGGLFTALIYNSQAASFAASKEAESGSIAGNAAALDLAGTSGGKGVRFGGGTVNTGTEYGLYVGYIADNPDWNAMKQDIDTLAANGQKWMRIGIDADLVAAGGSAGSIQWDQAGLKYYDDAFSYARSKGLKINVATAGAPGFTSDFSYNDYKRTASVFWSFLAQRYKTQIDVWQVFNEIDSSHYKHFDSLPYDLESAYLQEVNGLLAEARRVIKAANPNIIITTNCSGYPVDETTQGYYFKFFDAIKDNLDIISLDLYPDGNDDSVEMAGQRVADAKARYGKPVTVAEVGMPTCSGCYTTADVTKYMPATFAAMERGGASTILYYEMRDGGTDNSNGEDNFGVLEFDGTRKPFFDAIMRAMR